MAIVKTPPADLPTTNALSALPSSEPAEIRLSGKILCTLADPPELGAEIVLLVKLRVTEDCVAVHEDDSEVHYRKMKLISAWRQGSPPPPSNQGELWEQAPEVGTFSHEGQP